VTVYTLVRAQCGLPVSGGSVSVFFLTSSRSGH
jgi:hypothetical protein